VPTATIRLPRRLDGGPALAAIMPNFLRTYSDQLPDSVTLDFSALEFVTPAGVTFLMNCVYWLRNQAVECTLLPGPKLSDAVKYLDDCGFFLGVRGSNLRPFARQRPTSTRLGVISTEGSRAWIETELTPWLQNAVPISRPSFYPLVACLWELFNNVADHTRHDRGCIFGQHYPNKKELLLVFADFGIGIPASVRKVIDPITDQDAIVKSTEEGFSTRSTPQNRGAGLRYVLDVVVGSCRGRVTIHSHRGSVCFSNEGGQTVSNGAELHGYCPGTTIELLFPTAHIPIENEEAEPFEW
jgi:hypothetical protein